MNFTKLTFLVSLFVFINLAHAMEMDDNNNNNTKKLIQQIPISSSAKKNLANKIWHMAHEKKDHNNEYYLAFLINEEICYATKKEGIAYYTQTDFAHNPTEKQAFANLKTDLTKAQTGQSDIMELSEKLQKIQHEIENPQLDPNLIEALEQRMQQDIDNEVFNILEYKYLHKGQQNK